MKNFETLVKKLDIDLYTHVVDWEEFKDIQLSFIKSSTPDGEIPSDHAINALMFKVAAVGCVFFAWHLFNVLLAHDAGTGTDYTTRQYPTRAPSNDAEQIKHNI